MWTLSEGYSPDADHHRRNQLGLVGLFNFDLVNAIFGGDTRFAPSLASRVVYTLVALSGLYAFTFYRMGSEEESVRRGTSIAMEGRRRIARPAKWTRLHLGEEVIACSQ